MDYADYILGAFSGRRHHRRRRRTHDVEPGASGVAVRCNEFLDRAEWKVKHLAVASGFCFRFQQIAAARSSSVSLYHRYY